MALFPIRNAREGADIPPSSGGIALAYGPGFLTITEVATLGEDAFGKAS